MKRNLSNVTKDHVRRLENWLTLEDTYICPFMDNGIKCYRDICYEVFPLLDVGCCPCKESTLKSVKSVARLVIHKCQR